MSTALSSARSTLWRSSLRQTTRMISSIPVLPLQPPSLDLEAAEFEARTSEMADFFSLPRFANTKRPYPPSAVASKQGSLPVLPLPSTLLADKLFSIFTKAAQAGKPVHTMGAIDPVQMTQMARHQEVVYISGWAASSTLTTGNNEVGPDLGSVYLPNLPYHLADHYAVITHIRRFLTKSNESSAPSSYTTRSTMTSVYRPPRNNAPNWNTSTTFGLS